MVALTFHEVAHGYVAYLLGDPTAKMAGRLTLNPIKHLDLIGTLAFVLTRMIGWAKPVPINPSYFKNPAKGMILVSLAGPGSNFIMAGFFALLIRLIHSMPMPAGDSIAMDVLIPVFLMCQAGVVVNVALGIFNLLPIPPLDGSNALAGLLPPRAAYTFTRYGRYGMILVIILAVTGILGKFLFPMIQVLSNFYFTTFAGTSGF